MALVLRHNTGMAVKNRGEQDGKEEKEKEKENNIL